MPINALPLAVLANYEIHEWRHASAILERDFPLEWNDICDVLSQFRLCESFVTTPGGRKSQVSEWIDGQLYERGWVEKKFDTSVIIDGTSMTKTVNILGLTPGEDLLVKANQKYSTILADPPWQFQNRTGKMAPEHKRLLRYPTMDLKEIVSLPIQSLAAAKSHLYLWVPNALLREGLNVMEAWGFTYKSNLIWYKIRKDGGPDGRGVGFYFRNITELILFGTRGSIRTLQPGRTQVNILSTQKREHSRKPDEIYDIIESCSPGPYLELFARFRRNGWDQWGNEDVEENSFRGMALRNGHVDPQLRLLEPPSPEYKIK